MRNLLKTLGGALQTILLLPFAIVVATPVLAFLAVVFAVHLPQSLWSRHKWKKRLTHQGRFRNRQIIVSELRNGTLIVDEPTLGWGLQYCWWTPDEVRSIAPHAIPSTDDRQQHIPDAIEKLEMPFDRWVHERYLDTDTGSAILLATRRGDRFADALARRCPSIDVVNSWSGPVVFYNSCERPPKSTHQS